ncbi:MAG TPA: DinB family protein [Dehalococcoidia bacterium]|nr:DinB family protein [Dehalococcoidia bacterium]
MIDRSALTTEFEEAIGDLERALRECPDDLWEASAWRVKKTDAWVWPREGVTPVPERTEESIQSLSAVWVVAYHCLWFLDFYTSTGEGFESPEYVRGGPEEQGMAADGAARLPAPVYPREVLLRYLDHGRRKVRHTIATISEEELRAVCVRPGTPTAARPSNSSWK